MLVSLLCVSMHGFCVGDFCVGGWDKDDQATIIFLPPINKVELATLYCGLSDPTSQGGLVFYYFVNLSACEMWTLLLENVSDHDWNMMCHVSSCGFGSDCNSNGRQFICTEHSKVVLPKMGEAFIIATATSFKSCRFLKVVAPQTTRDLNTVPHRAYHLGGCLTSPFTTVVWGNTRIKLQDLDIWTKILHSEISAKFIFSTTMLMFS